MFTIQYPHAVVDVTPPSITNCPTNIVQVTTSMSSFVVVMWDELIVEDVSQPIQQIEGPDGFTAVFLLGTTTTVNYAYQDSVGNIGRCAFDVTIRCKYDDLLYVFTYLLAFFHSFAPLH